MHAYSLCPGVCPGVCLPWLRMHGCSCLTCTARLPWWWWWWPADKHQHGPCAAGGRVVLIDASCGMCGRLQCPCGCSSCCAAGLFAGSWLPVAVCMRAGLLGQSPVCTPQGCGGDWWSRVPIGACPSGVRMHGAALSLTLSSDLDVLLGLDRCMPCSASALRVEEAAPCAARVWLQHSSAGHGAAAEAGPG